MDDTHHRVMGFLWARTGKAVPYAMHSGGESIKVQGRYVLSVDDGNAYLAVGLAGLGVNPTLVSRRPIISSKVLGHK